MKKKEIIILATTTTTNSTAAAIENGLKYSLSLPSRSTRLVLSFFFRFLMDDLIENLNLTTTRLLINLMSAFLFLRGFARQREKNMSSCRHLFFFQLGLKRFHLFELFRVSWDWA